MQNVTSHLSPLRILVVEDDDVFRERLARALRRRGHKVQTAATGVEAALVASDGLDVALIDFKLPHGNGLSVLGDVRQRWPDAVLVLASGSPLNANAIQSLAAAGATLLAKPFDADDVLRFIASMGKS